MDEETSAMKVVGVTLSITVPALVFGIFFVFARCESESAKARYEADKVRFEKGILSDSERLRTE